MSLVFAVDANNDLYLGPDGNIARASALAAVTQAAQQAAQTQLGEMIYATDEGVPYFGTVWQGKPNRAQFEAFLRRTLLRVVDVLEVQSLSTSVQNNALTYRAVIRTTFGTGLING